MKKTAAVLYGTLFENSAAMAKAYLAKKNYRVVLYKPIPFWASINQLPRTSETLDFMVWYSHGGWDGPMVFDLSGTVPQQASPSEPKEWAQLKAYFLSQMKPKAAYLAHSCHSAGSDWREKKTEIFPRGVWVRDVAKDMNIYTFGQSGKSAAQNPSSAKRMLDYVFSGKRRGMPFHAFAPSTGIEITDTKSFLKL